MQGQWASSSSHLAYRPAEGRVHVYQDIAADRVVPSFRVCSCTYVFMDSYLLLHGAESFLSI